MPHIQRQALRDILQIQSANCIECGLCCKQCTFLQQYGTPKHIADRFDPTSSKDLNMPFECSLCGLCRAICPAKINPAAMFLEMRREAVLQGKQLWHDYSRLLSYEKRGVSKRYSYYALPANCDTVFFPGCALSGTRHDKVKDIYEHLQNTIPQLGIVLDCCTKPSHDLGREHFFHSMFYEMQEFLQLHNVKNILVACPSCYQVFQEYGAGLQVKTIYEHLAATVLPLSTLHATVTVTVHDPCTTRDEPQIHAAIRQLIRCKSLTIHEMNSCKTQTLCCGEGGAVGCVRSDYSASWGIQRKKAAGNYRIITYCAGCAHLLGNLHPTSHIIDLFFDPQSALAGKTKVAKAPWTYLYRLFLKRYFKKSINAAVSRERTFTGERASQRDCRK
ncbi:MAG: (Fe-S)-binding protein [Candidatus Electrothrix sp. AW1]|nr:(Fe-S)-binding protein [Candidatus Electrothrix sp. AX1]MCI5183771.1 (Fe-S)-binding protein [Candidatus Electrothrix gigas]